MPPSAAPRRPRSGKPPRLMPTPSEPQPVPLHGGTKFGVGPTRVRASTSAPRSSKQRDDVGMRLAHGEHQRRLLELAVARVDGGAAVEQQRDGVDDARAHRRHQRGLADRRDAIHVGAGIEQRRDDGRVAVLGREIQRRHAVAIGGARVGAGLEQQANRVEAVGARGPVQGRGSVDGARVDGARPDRAGGSTAMRSPFSAASINGGAPCGAAEARPAASKASDKQGTSYDRHLRASLRSQLRSLTRPAAGPQRAVARRRRGTAESRAVSRSSPC